MVGFVVVVIRQ